MRPTSQLGRLVLAVVAGGVLLAALAAPLVLGPGLVAAWITDRGQTAPVEQPLHGNTAMLAADGSLITEFYERNRSPVALDRIAPVMQQAIVDIEDSRFYRHGAIDLVGTLRALVLDVRSHSTEQGGSTLTQQLVKQTLEQHAGTVAAQRAAVADTLSRKLTEARLAIGLENRLSKQEILDRYLNTVYFGAGAYGVQAAAEAYFSTDAAHLTPSQAATLAGLVQNPSADDPIDHPDRARQRRDEVLDRMHQLGHLSAADLAAATAQPVTVQPAPSPPNGCAQAVIGGFFCDYAQTYLTGTLGLSRAQLETGGLTIQTTLRPDLQSAGDQAVVKTVGMDDPRAGIYTVVEPGTGKVLAMSVNRHFGCDGSGCTSVNLNVAAARGAGSTYKLFTTTSALEQGYRMDFTQTTSDPFVSRVYKQNGGTPARPTRSRTRGTTGRRSTSRMPWSSPRTRTSSASRTISAASPDR